MCQGRDAESIAGSVVGDATRCAGRTAIVSDAVPRRSPNVRVAKSPLVGPDPVHFRHQRVRRGRRRAHRTDGPVDAAAHRSGDAAAHRPEVGAGIEPVAGSFATFHYTVWLYDPAGTDTKGTRIQSSRDGGVPSTFRLGTNATIVGFEQAVSTMKVGGIRRAIIPPSLGYGTTGNSDGSIPPNGWIVFEIELLAVT